MTNIPSVDAGPPVAERPERFQISSLDGGGIRGLFSAAVLAAIEEDGPQAASVRKTLLAHFAQLKPPA